MWNSRAQRPSEELRTGDVIGIGRKFNSASRQTPRLTQPIVTMSAQTPTPQEVPQPAPPQPANPPLGVPPGAPAPEVPVPPNDPSEPDQPREVPQQHETGDHAGLGGLALHRRAVGKRSYSGSKPLLHSPPGPHQPGR